MGLKWKAEQPNKIGATTGDGLRIRSTHVWYRIAAASQCDRSRWDAGFHGRGVPWATWARRQELVLHLTSEGSNSTSKDKIWSRNAAAESAVNQRQPRGPHHREPHQPLVGASACRLWPSPIAVNTLVSALAQRAQLLATSELDAAPGDGANPAMPEAG